MKPIALAGLLILALGLCDSTMVHGQVSQSHSLHDLRRTLKDPMQYPRQSTIDDHSLRASIRAMEEGDMSEIEESKLVHWKPDAHSETAPLPEIRRPEMSLDGTWRVSRGMDGTTLWVRMLPSGSCVVTFQTGGCLGHWTLKRTGQILNGIMTLDRPVAEYLPLTYRRLYAVRVGGTDYLVPAPAVRDFEQNLSHDPHRRVPTFATGFYGLQRTILPKHKTLVTKPLRPKAFLPTGRSASPSPRSAFQGGGGAM
jgi:hypothetical protein